MAAGKGTVLRSIRLSEEHDALLEEEAKRKGLSVNSLITSLITKYAEWDRFAERYGYVSVARWGFKSIFELLPPELLIAHGKEVGEKSVPDIVRFWFGKLNLQTFLSSLELYSKYSGIFHYELSSTSRSYSISIHHELGPNYNIVVTNYFDQAIRKIVGVIPLIETGNNSIVVTFEEPNL